VNLHDYLGAAEVEQPLPRSVAELFESFEPVDLTEPLSQNRPAIRTVAYEDLRDLVLARYRWMERQAVVAELAADLPADLLGGVLLAYQVPAYLEAHKQGAGDDAIRAAYYQLWTACLEAAHATTTVSVSPAGKNHPRAAQYLRFEGDRGVASEITAEDWIELRRGVRGDVITLAWTHSVDALAEAGTEALGALSGLVGSKTPAEFIEAELLASVATALHARLDLEGEETVVGNIAKEYEGLLAEPALKVQPAGAVYVGTNRQRLGMVAFDKRGGVSATAPMRPSGDWPARVARWMKDHRVRAVVLPTTAVAAEWLETLATGLEELRMRTVRVSPAGIVEARSIDDPALRRVSPEEASAIVIARRGVRPLDEWCRIDPTRLGLSRIQAELNGERLREVLQLVRERTIADAQPLSTAPVTTGGIRGRAAAPLNPAVTHIRDLRPGLQLQGMVTNVTKFGAFINIGLRQEGLVHISELADDFVAEPAEVVQVGQQVSCRVISIDLDRGRIALSMRSENAPPRVGAPRAPRRPMDRMGSSGPQRRGGGSGSASPTSGPTGADRNKALADLEKLFSK
jgi:predicted RNA-binding protein with RPS1 domain